MRTFLSTILICLYFNILPAQSTNGAMRKSPIDTADILHWPIIPDGPGTIISNNGEYLLYRAWHIPPGSASTMIRATGRNWETALISARQATFTDDSRHVVFITQHNSLCLLTLPDVRREYEENVHSFELFMHKGNEMLIYQRANQERELVLYELTTSLKKVYDNIDGYIVSKNGQSMVLQTSPSLSGNAALLWVDIGTKEPKTIWKGSNPGSLCFDDLGKQLAFLVYDSTTGDNALWLYNADKKNAVEYLKPGPGNPGKLIKLAAISNFDRSGKKLFLQLTEKSQSHSNINESFMTVWNYIDPKLQTLQTGEKMGGTPSYLAVLSIQPPHNVWRLQQQNENITTNNEGDLIVSTFQEGSGSESYWNKAAFSSTSLINLNERKRTPLPLINITFSPNQKYLLGNKIAEPWGSDLYLYELSTHTFRNITKSIPLVSRRKESDMVETSNGKGLIVACWLPADSGLLVYDDYDIWQVDPTGKKNAINLTKGREKKIQFRLADDEYNFPKENIKPGQPVLLTAFNIRTKQNGFCQLKWATGRQPEPLFMGDHFFSKIGTNSHFLKARDRNIYLVRREETGQAPNIFSTEDFRNFSPVTHLHPEKSVNWFTSELVTFSTTDGIETKAILYKPENFDPKNKYPLLIHYYDKLSDELNRYRPPQGWGTGADLDVAWFASNGYLVLLTDIYFDIDKPGESIYKAVTGAAKHIVGRLYVDKDRIGIQGHSFGGYETNYLVTHSGLFTAAVSSAGVSDAMSSYGSLWPDGNSVQEYFEQRAYRIIRPPWHAPFIYKNNSPLFSVSHVNTPVLIVHNKGDRNVSFEQGLEFFTSLRRAGKRAWMLQYDNGGHGLRGDDYKDYIFKTSQFFNHYLKGAPPPEWMTRGIPASMKGVYNRLSLDKDIKTPGNSPLINK